MSPQGQEAKMATTPQPREPQGPPEPREEPSGGLGLFETPGLNVYAVLDGASVHGLPAMLQKHRPESYCLYREDLTPDIAEVAPYVVTLEAGTEFAEWVLAKGWGKHWGVFALSERDGRTMRQHFRKFVKVESPEGKPLYFRFYDPRVLRTFLPTCNAAELAELFGPVACYVMEGEEAATVLRFELADGELRRTESQRAS